MELNKNPNEAFEYNGPPKKEHFGMMLFSMVLAVVALAFAYYYNTKLEAIARGEEVEIYHKFYDLYTVFGKWAVLILFIGMALGMFYAAYHHYKKYLESKEKK